MRTFSAYIDESGDPNFTEGSTPTLFLGAVVLPTAQVEELEARVEQIRAEFKIAEFKSSRVRSYRHRVDICKRLVDLEFRFVTLHVRKADLRGNWFRRRESFYKYVQKVLNTEVYRLFDDVQIKIDKYGSSSYQHSVKEYLDRSLQRELFTPEVEVSTAKESCFIQVADFLSGTLRKILEGDFEDSGELEAVLEAQWTCRKPIPDVGKVVSPVPNVGFTHCMDEAKRFLDKDEHEEHDPQVLTLDYLYHTALVYPNTWVYTQEIQQWLSDFGVHIGEEQFRNEITAALRDQGVVVVGTRKGLKIPTCSEDIREYSEFCVKLALPVLRRLKRALQFMEAREDSPAYTEMLSDEVRGVLSKVNA